MKTIGMIGGMSWESTVTYYQILNTIVKQRLGGYHSAKCLLYSVDFSEIEAYQASGNWKKSAEVLTDIAQKLEGAGVDFIIICTNTMHKVADTVQQNISIPLLHIAACTADVLQQHEIKTVALLGTQYTMEQDFYTAKLEQAGIRVMVPNADDRASINNIIFNELCLGRIEPASKIRMLAIIDQLAAQGAQGVVLGCTEIGLLVNQQDTPVQLFDTTQIHAERAARLALGEPF